MPPFAVDRAVLRRARADDIDEPVQIGGPTIDLRSRVAAVDGLPMDLSRKEFDLLWHLATRRGEVISKRELLAAVWRQPYGGPEKTVDVHLSWRRLCRASGDLQPVSGRTADPATHSSGAAYETMETL